MFKIAGCKLLQKYRVHIIIVFLSALPLQVFSQTPADSLRLLMRDANNTRKGELTIELANYFLAQNADSAIYYSKAAQNIGKINNDYRLIIRSYAKIGEAYQKQNKIKDAIANYLKGLELAGKHNEKSLEGTIYNGIAVCYFYQNNAIKAEQYLKLAAQAKKDANDYQYYAIITTNIAILQISNKLPEKAIKTLRNAENTLVIKKQPQYLATVYNSMGAAYQTIKPDSCLYYYQKSAEIAAKHNDILNQMTANQNIGDYYFEKKNYTEAIQFMTKAITINNKRPEDQFKPALYERISQLYNAAGNYENAYRYKKLENDARQRLFTVQKQKEIEELEIRYQSEKKEKELQLSKQEIERSKSQRNLLLVVALMIFIVAAFVIYMILNRRKITREFEQEKLKMVENIFHEIRTPLTLIDGPIQVMKHDGGINDPEQLVFLERNSKRMIRLVDELMDASELGKGSFQINYSAGSVSDFIDEIINNLANDAAAGDRSIINDKKNIQGYYSFPANALEKILYNLIGNALKYTPAGSEVRVTSNVDKEKLVLNIKDNGPGIPKNEFKKVFRRFFRGKYSTGTRGTGIGLSLVKEIVELANGTITLQSGGVGTIFTVTLPVSVLQNNHITVNTDEDMPTLLLAEDDADTAAFITSVLQESFRITHAKNGLQAIEIIHDNLPDIVVSDIAMPEKDGIGLLKDIRSDELSSHIPVILLSAKTSLENRLEGLTHGADAYISKPFSPRELKLIVQNLFSTMQHNRQLYQSSVKSEKTFTERINNDNPYVNKIVENIILNIDNPEYSVNELSSDMNVSRSQLHRKLTALTGFSATNFIRMIRLEKAKDMLLTNSGNISEIAYKCGFNSPSYFTKSFTEYFGKSPSHFTKNQ